MYYTIVMEYEDGKTFGQGTQFTLEELHWIDAQFRMFDKMDRDLEERCKLKQNKLRSLKFIRIEEKNEQEQNQRTS